ncbi:MAG TPA: hypothetical protein VF715_06865 [Thermoleophilaceae bacterium]|jgi:hypothetical protein
MRRNLVISRVGANSLHPGWIDPNAERTWDLYLSPYQPIPDQGALDCQVGEVIAGPKWTGIRDVLASWDGWREYDHVWLPDDDIAATPDAINAMFEVAEGAGLDLFAPALDEGSYYAHFIAMRNTSFFGRRVGFVEIMIPGFSRAGLERLAPTFAETETGWGWGLDSVWPKLLGYTDVGIIDAVTVSHTRAVGVMRDEDLRRRVHEESDMLLERYECRQEHVTFGAFGEDLQPLDLAPEALLAGLVDGWDYLIERDPRVLWWIAEFQRRHSGGPEYPVAGTPES